MEITVKGQTYKVSKFTPNMVLRADELIENGSMISLGDEKVFFQEVVPFLADTVFSGQFTPADFMEGYESETVTVDILGMLGAVRGVVLQEMAKFPKEPEPKNAPGSRKKSRSANLS